MGRELYLINKDKYLEVKKQPSTYIVTGLPKNLNNAEFRKHLESFGEVVISELYFIKDNGQLYVDYGKVSFENVEQGHKYLEAAQNGEIKIEDCVV